MEENVVVNAENTLPKEYKPLSAWAYFGYQLLFAIPFVGFILLIVFHLIMKTLIVGILLDHIFV